MSHLEPPGRVPSYHTIPPLTLTLRQWKSRSKEPILLVTPSITRGRFRARANEVTWFEGYAPFTVCRRCARGGHDVIELKRLRRQWACRLGRRPGHPCLRA